MAKSFALWWFFCSSQTCHLLFSKIYEILGKRFCFVALKHYMNVYFRFSFLAIFNGNLQFSALYAVVNRALCLVRHFLYAWRLFDQLSAVRSTWNFACTHMFDDNTIFDNQIFRFQRRWKMTFTPPPPSIFGCREKYKNIGKQLIKYLCPKRNLTSVKSPRTRTPAWYFVIICLDYV